MTSPDKNILRARMAQTRKSAARQSTDAGQRLCEQFQTAADLQAVKCWSAYWPLPSELDSRPLMHHLVQQAKTVCLPVVAAEKSPLIFRQWQPDTQLVKGLHNIPAPGNECALLIPDGLFVPLLGFDKKGGRLGFGGGYYDRTLEMLRHRLTPSPVVIGIAFDEQELDHVPMDVHDQFLDGVLTPSRTLSCTGK